MEIMEIIEKGKCFNQEGEIIYEIEEIDLINDIDLSNLNLEEIPENLKEISNLEKLTIKNNNIKSFKNIEYLKYLKYLDISHNEIKNMNYINKCLNLETIYLHNNNINIIKNLDNLHYLTWFSISDNPLEYSKYSEPYFDNFKLAKFNLEINSLYQKYNQKKDKILTKYQKRKYKIIKNNFKTEDINFGF